MSPVASISILEILISAVLIIIPILVVILGLFFLVKLISGNRSESGAGSAAELKMAQEIHGNLQRMEKRIESLETILLDQMRDDEHDKH